MIVYKALHLRDDIDRMCQRKEWGRLVVKAFMKGLDDYIKKSK